MAPACQLCGADHGEPARAYAAALPEAILAIPPRDRERRAILGDDSASLDDQQFFLRGNLVIPIDDAGADLVWSVWAEVDRRTYKRALALWRNPARVDEAPYAATLATVLPAYPASLGVALRVVSQPVGHRARLEVAPDHDLARAIAPARLGAIADRVAHGL
jgi:hypothetical protein